jgi:hypothetical protein
MVAGRSSHQGAAGVRPRPGQSMGLRHAHRVEDGKSADFHLPLPKLEGLHQAAREDRACHSKRTHLSGRRQPEVPQQRAGERVARRASEDRARFHPERRGVAEPHRGLVATVPAAGFGQTGLRRWFRDRPSSEGSHPAAKPESQAVGVVSRPSKLPRRRRALLFTACEERSIRSCARSVRHE